MNYVKRAFECELKNAYGIEIQNGMTCIPDNEVNNIAELNLLHDILNYTKRKNIPFLYISTWMYEYKKG